MSIQETPTLDHVLMLATRLPPTDKLRLIERLAPQVAQALITVTSEDDESLTELDALIAEAATLARSSQDSAEIVSELRR